MKSKIVYNFGSVVLEAASFDSRADVRARLAGETRSLLLESEEYIDEDGILFVTASDRGGRWMSFLGVLFTHVELGVQFARHPSEGYVWLAFDSCVHLLSLREPKSLAQVTLDGIFVHLIAMEDGSAVVVSELEAIGLESDGRRRWTLQGPDMLEDFRVHEFGVRFTYADGSEQQHPF